MASPTLFVAFALTLLAVNATTMSSPEPEIDPMGGPALAVVSSGSMKRPSHILSDGDKICPGDYPTGFSILCIPGGPTSRARFFVNGSLVKKEYKMPYYIAGDFKGRVKPWTDYPPMAFIRCKLSRRVKVSVNVKFEC